MINIGVLISGSGSNLQALIESIESGFIPAKLAVVVSSKKKAYGLERAQKKNIPAFFISKKENGSLENFNKKLIEKLEEHKVDLVVLAGFLSILSPEFIAKYRNKIINIHPSLIPAFCGNGFYGLNVHQSALDYGVKLSGATVHFVDEGTDTGPIILQKAVEVLENDTPESLQKRVLEIEHELLPLAVKYFCENKLRIITEDNSKTKVLVLV